ncbi:MAG: caspase family protein [Nostoc sp. ZfuVER08]|nr:caspase family protein [Nostoc sp. ZfuVER08]
MSKSKYKFYRDLAVIIGINNYSNGIPELETPVPDAKKLAKILQENYQYEAQILLNEKATLKQLNFLLEDFKQKTLRLPDKTVQIEENDRLIFYFAGHGIVLRDGLENTDNLEGYIVPQDARGDILLQNNILLPMQDLHDALAQLPCRHLLIILDCCFAGAFRSSLYREIVPARKVYKQRYDRFIKDRAWQAIASAAHDQKAIDHLGCFGQRGSTGKHSPFAEALFEGLRGAADTTLREGDGIITATELYCYLRDRVEELTDKYDKRQTPGLFPLKKHDKGEYIFLLPNFDQNNLEDAPALKEENNPYRGLKSYEEEHSLLFFGRDELVKELSTHVSQTNNPLTVVLGISGSGKSSLVKAGLIPYLRKHHNQEWYIIPTIRPGDNPFTSLAEALVEKSETDGNYLNKIQSLNQTLKQIPQDFIKIIQELQPIPQKVKILLVIDQFEELITVCNPQEKEQFLNFLGSILEAHPQQMTIVLTLRSDFEPRFLDSALKAYWTQSRFPIRAMRSDELRQAIERPANEKMLDFDPPNLVDQLIDEVGQMPGALSLLSFTLSELYIKAINRESRTLSKTDYDTLGGVAGSLTQRATQEYQTLVKLDPAYEHTVRQLMLRMVAIEGNELARRRVPMSELEYESVEKNQRVSQAIARFSAARLIVEGKEIGDEPYVEPAHDALVNGWNKLQEWKNLEQESLVLRQRLTPSANDWLKNGCKSDYLWIRDPRLAILEKVLELPSEENWLNQLETEFVKTSIQKRQDELEETKEQLRISEERRIEAEKQNAIALARNSEALLSSNQQLEALIAAVKAGIKLQNLLAEKAISLQNLLFKQTVIALERAVYGVRERNRLEGHSGPVQSVCFSPDGKMIATASWDNIVKLWSREGKELKTLKGHYDGVLSVCFSPNGKTVVSTGWDNTIRIWNLEGQELTQHPLGFGHRDQVWCVCFSPDGEMIASASHDRRVKLWNKDGQFLRNLCESSTTEHELTVSSVCFSPNGQIIATASYDNTVKLWNLDGTLIKSFTHHGTVYDISFSIDGNTIASASADKTVKIWSLNDKKPVTLKGHEGEVTSVRFSPDGKIIASGSKDNYVKLWSKDGQEITTLRGHTAEITSVNFSLDGNIIASASQDSTVKIWSKEGQQITILPEYGEGVTQACFSPDGKTIVGNAENTLKLWNLDTQESKIFSDITGAKNGISFSFSPDGNAIAVCGGFDKMVKLCNLEGQEIKNSNDYYHAIRAIRFSPDGKTIAFNNNRKIDLWNWENQEIKTLSGHTGQVWSLCFSPDSEIIVSGSDGSDKTIKLWNLSSGEFIPLEGHSNSVNQVCFSPDGEIIASASSDNTVKLWNLNGQELKTLRGHSYQVFDVIFSLDGEMIASADWDGTIKLWNRDGQLLTTLEKRSEKVSSISFSPDVQILAVASNKGVILWNFNLNDLVVRGCSWLHDYLMNNSNVQEERNLCCNFRTNAS